MDGQKLSSSSMIREGKGLNLKFKSWQMQGIYIVHVHVQYCIM